ncbi:MAG: hypothetical protein Kow0068_13350 [Marinilabiliales bacterium]
MFNLLSYNKFSVKFLLLLFITTSFNIYATGNKADSLKKLINKNPDNNCNIYLELGSYYIYENMDSSLYYLTKALNIVRNTGKPSEANILRALGKLYCAFGKYKEGIHYNLKALKLFYKNKNYTEIPQTLNNLGILYSYDYDMDKSLLYHRKALRIIKLLKDSNQLMDTYNNIGTAKYYLSEYDSALYYFNLGMLYKDGVTDPFILGALYNNIALTYHSMGNYEKAINNYIIANKYFEKAGRDDAVSLTENNIGALYTDLGFHNKAMELYKKKLKQAKLRNDMVEYCNSLNNIGLTLSNLGLQDSALTIYLEALDIVDTLQDNNVKSLIYKNTGDQYLALNMPDKSLIYLKKAEKIRIEAGNPHEISSLYASISDAYIQLKDYKKALDYCLISYKIAKEIDDFTLQSRALISLGEIYNNLGNFKESARYYLDYIELRDTMINENVQKQISDLETKYQTEKKEQQIKLQKTELDKQEAIISRNKLEKRALTIIGILFLILGLVIYRSYRQKRKSVILIKQKNTILEQANEEIKAQRDEIETQRDLATQQRELIEQQNKEIMDSITYAKRIQSSILQEKSSLNNLFADSFVFFVPRDIVSGDFYWWAEIENNIVVTVADCTGHGVPGAFMSMLGVSLLREIVTKEYITHPGVILRKLRKEIIKALKQKGEAGEQKDGMDMALISYNKNNNIVQFAGANNSIYVVSNEQNEELDNLIYEQPYFYEIKPDKMPIAIYEKMDSFTTHEFKLKHGDVLYLFSDGFADQFGGNKGKKFMYKPFKKLLKDISNQPMINQLEHLETTYNNWKGEFEQVDDVTVIGIRI